jgi:WhiB family redox-sensing transcriptional regulator
VLQSSPPQESQWSTGVPTQHTSSSSRTLGGPWHSEAACRRDEAGLFFAPSQEPTAARLSREQAAKSVCARCPVLLECREHALVQPEPYGVWGGLTAAERRVMLSRRRRREAATGGRVA